MWIKAGIWFTRWRGKGGAGGGGGGKYANGVFVVTKRKSNDRMKSWWHLKEKVKNSIWSFIFLQECFPVLWQKTSWLFLEYLVFLSLLPKTKGAILSKHYCKLPFWHNDHRSWSSTKLCKYKKSLLSVRHSLGMGYLNKACNKHPSEVKMFFNTFFRSERASTCWSFDNQVWRVFLGW